MRLIFPDGQKIYYAVPVMKYWEYDDRRLIKEKMYPLLPLQLFKLRYNLDKIARSKNNSNALKDIILKAKQTAETIAKEGRDHRRGSGQDTSCNW